MKKFLRNQKGFSMIELLVALLIMAVIAGIAIAVFGNIVGKTRTNADAESAAQIKKQLLYYINEANDPDLSCILATGGTNPITSANDLVDRLGGITTITESAVGGVTTRSYSGTTNVENAPTAVRTWSGNTTQGEVLGDYGPYIDGTKQLRPQSQGNLNWVIDVNTANQQITVTSTSAAISGNNTLNIHNN